MRLDLNCSAHPAWARGIVFDAVLRPRLQSAPAPSGREQGPAARATPPNPAARTPSPRSTHPLSSRPQHAWPEPPGGAPSSGRPWSLPRAGPSERCWAVRPPECSPGTPTQVGSGVQARTAPGPELALSPDPGRGDLKAVASGLDPELHDLHLWLGGVAGGGAPAGTLHPGPQVLPARQRSRSRACEAWGGTGRGTAGRGAAPGPENGVLPTPAPQGLLRPPRSPCPSGRVLSPPAVSLPGRTRS